MEDYLMAGPYTLFTSVNLRFYENKAIVVRVELNEPLHYHKRGVLSSKQEIESGSPSIKETVGYIVDYNVVARGKYLNKDGWIDINPFGKHAERNSGGSREGSIRIPIRHINNIESVLRVDFAKLVHK